MAFSDEEILEEFAEAAGQGRHATEWLESGFILKRLKARAKRRKQTPEEYAAYKLRWYLSKRDTPKYKRNRVKAQLAYAARNNNRLEYKKEWYAKKGRVKTCEKQLLKYLQLYLTFNPAEAKRQHVVALIQLFQT